MDSQFEQRFYQFLAGREGKAPKTRKSMMRTFRRMDRDGFDFALFASGEEAAQEEGDRYLLWLQTAPPLPRGRRPRPDQEGRGGQLNVQKVMMALCRLHRYKDVTWRVRQRRPGQRDCYTAEELRKMLRLPYGRSEGGLLDRAAVFAHLGLGWREDELNALEDTHIDPSTCTVLLAHPEKGNPQRRLPREPAFFAGHDGTPGARNPLMAWNRRRPKWPSNPHRVWVYTEARTGKVKPIKVSKVLGRVGRRIGVRMNCTRGRHTRCAAHLAQGKQLAWVKYDMSGPQGSINTLTSYIEMISLGLLEHLRNPAWFVRPPPKQEA